ELTADVLDAIQVLPGRPKPAPPVGDFSYIEVVGCLARGPEHSWLLTRASAPVSATVARASAAPAPSLSPATPLGRETFHLVDAVAYSPNDRTGQKVYVRGLLIRMPDEQRMTISTLETLSPTCGSD